jgi:predicted RNase H-like nuclease (RuvC/YqgF family)
MITTSESERSTSHERMVERTPGGQQCTDQDRIAMNDNVRLHKENAQLIGRLSRLRAAVEALTHDNAELCRAVASLRRENRNLKAALLTPVTRESREAHLHSMLREPCSRNP